MGPPPARKATTDHIGGCHGMWSCGRLFAALRDANLFEDPKAIVDRPLLASPPVVTTSFEAVPRGPDGKMDGAMLMSFVEEHFALEGSDLEELVPQDWSEKGTEWLQSVPATGPMRDWAKQLNELWKCLYKKANPSPANPDRHSLLPVPHPILVAGGRFREMYYWDSYWTVKGLLVCGMHRTASLQVENLLYLLDQHGHVPNGNRVYYLNRSQPPLLSAMVDLIWQATGCVEFLAYATPLLVREHSYWMVHPHCVRVKGLSGQVHNLSRYHADWTLPRPESYGADVVTASLATARQPEAVYRDLASAAESGWDFSSRWLQSPCSLHTIRTTSVVPADLNGFLFQMETNIARFAAALNDNATCKAFQALARARQAAMDDVLWNGNSHQWKDFLLETETHCECDAVKEIVWDGSQSSGTYASNWLPLWCGLQPANGTDAEEVVESCRRSGLICSAGIATSLVESGQQWDFPNGWPPLQCMLIEGLMGAGPKGMDLAQSLARAWLATNFETFQKTGHMHEKYDVREIGRAGAGGEYTPQVGFGWTNGVALFLLQTFGWQA
ncbi:unnamed protein product [Ostreobium quekettii]|uniref:Trehalase n=1 Tax=Ostreobium quekettii TaxID=121088 RepID=A0A8S1J4E3_9CHLO|nr:unnamed protein product [Ostreobium quekettii]|eukprot:evm.model.scf_667.4 EVM.evm.TU.scf_667.4   scf_667:28876-33162(+)